MSRERERALERWENQPWENGSDEWAAVQIANEALHESHCRRYKEAFRAGYDARASDAPDVRSQLTEALERARELQEEIDETKLEVDELRKQLTERDADALDMRVAPVVGNRLDALEKRVAAIESRTAPTATGETSCGSWLEQKKGTKNE